MVQVQYGPFFIPDDRPRNAPVGDPPASGDPPGGCRVLPSPAEFCRALPDSAECCQVLPNPARFCQVLPSDIRCKIFCGMDLKIRPRRPDASNSCQDRKSVRNEGQDRELMTPVKPPLLCSPLAWLQHRHRTPSAQPADLFTCHPPLTHRIFWCIYDNHITHWRARVKLEPCRPPRPRRTSRPSCAEAVPRLAGGCRFGRMARAGPHADPAGDFRTVVTHIIVRTARLSPAERVQGPGNHATRRLPT